MTSPRIQAAGSFSRYLDDLGASAPVPPRHVLDRAPTRQDVADFPAYYILGAGHAAASTTLCPHDYFLTDSCPCCDND